MKTEKYIIIKNCTKEELKTMLNDWLVEYVDGLSSKMIFEFAKINSTAFVLKVDKSIDDTDFFYMVNYFSYPIDLNKTFKVEGYAAATKHKRLLDKNIYVFINEKDDEYDNVWITTEDNETYKFDFGGGFKKMDFDNKYKALDINSLQTNYEQINIDKKELLEKAKRRKEEKSERSIEKRFKIISTIVFVLIPLAFLINSIFTYFSDEMLIYFCTAIVTMWFFVDYKIFNNIKRTLICLLLSLLCIVFGINAKDNFMVTVATIPMSSTVVMWAVNRFLGAKLDDIYDSRWDRLFMLALLAIAIFISVFVFNPILKFLK